MEDKEPLGFDYMKLGLDSVLLDPKTGMLYTPNTNQFTKMGEKPLINADESGIIEERAGKHWTKGQKGWFTGSVSNGSGGRARMSKTEFNRVCSAIITNKPLLKIGATSDIFYGNSYYIFRVIEPGTYKFDYKISLRHTKVIDKWRKFYDF